MSSLTLLPWTASELDARFLVEPAFSEPRFRHILVLGRFYHG